MGAPELCEDGDKLRSIANAELGQRFLTAGGWCHRNEPTLEASETPPASCKVEGVYQPVSWNNQSRLLAVIVRNYANTGPGIQFFTDPTLPQQVAHLSHPAGKKIDPHFHSEVPREIKTTAEVLIITKGYVRVDFFVDDGSAIINRYLHAGDICILIEGGHGFEVLEDLEAIEVKQGPYAGDKDKVRFNK